MAEENKWSMTSLLRVFAVILVIGGIGLGVMAFTSTEAANDFVAILDDGGEDPETPPGPFFDRGGFRGFPRGRHGNFGSWGDLEYDSFLADALGITLQELQAAYREAHTAMLEEAVARGYVSEEDAALIQARQALVAYIDRAELMAEALGISLEDLQEARTSDKTLSELFDELELDPEAAREAMQAAYEKAVQEAVDEVVITQDQADQILEGTRGFPMIGGRGRFGGRGGFFGDERPCPCCPDKNTTNDTSL